MNIRKIGGLFILGLGIPFALYASDRVLLCSFGSLGLMLYFFSPEKINDERVQLLKMKATFTALGACFGVLLVMHANHLDQLAQATSRRMRGGVDALEFLAVVLLIAQGLFSYWRWQDGRTDRSG